MRCWRYQICCIGILITAVSNSLAAPASAGDGSRKGRKGDIDAYSLFPPKTPARAKDGWVKIWHNKAGWHVAWQLAFEWIRGKDGRPTADTSHLKGVIRCKGGGKIGEVTVRGLKIDKLDHNDKAIALDSLLGPASRSIHFKATADRVTFDLIIGGTRRPSAIVIGANCHSPKRVPFTLKTPVIPKPGYGRRDP